MREADHFYLPVWMWQDSSVEENKKHKHSIHNDFAIGRGETLTYYSLIENIVLFPGLATLTSPGKISKSVLPNCSSFVQYKRQEKSEYRLAFLLQFFTYQSLHFAKSAEDLPRPGNSE